MLASFKYICVVAEYMVVTNVEILSRKIKEFTATSEDSSEFIQIQGKYVIDIQNKGLLPTSNLSMRLNKFTYGSDNDILSAKTKDIGRVNPSSTKTIEFSISSSITVTPENLGLVERSCNNKLITATSEEKIIGRFFAKSFSKSGGITAISNNCSVPQLQKDDEDTQTEPEPEPEPQPEPNPEEDNQDNEDNQNQNDNNNEENNDQQEQESEIMGPNILSVGQNAQFRWSDFPPDTVTFRWQVLAEQGSSNEPTTLELAEGSAQDLILNFISEAQGDFLIRIIATANGETLEQAQKVVSVLPGGAANT